jgi:ABC-type polysaccharide/polyol phosphate export permease
MNIHLCFLQVRNAMAVQMSNTDQPSQLQAGWQETRSHLRVAASLASRDLLARYARSALGPLWLIATPLAMLGVYWAVFSLALGVTWPGQAGGQPVGFVLPFMAGLAVYLYFSEVVTSSLGLYVAKRNLVLKSPLPLWVIWLANFLRASVVAAPNLVLLVLIAIMAGTLSIKGMLGSIPVIFLVVALLAPLSLLLTLIGPFADDLTNVTPVVLRIMFYAAPITFPLSLIPEFARPYFWLNPLTSLVELLRATIVFSETPSLSAYIAMAILAACLCFMATWCYRRIYRVVRDVV